MGGESTEKESPPRRRLRQRGLTITEFVCTDRPGQRPRPEQHERSGVAIVRSGAFCYSARGRTHALSAGSLLLGNAGDEYVCTHDYGHGDICLSFQWSVDTLEHTALRSGRRFRTPVLPPVPRVEALSRIALRAADGEADAGLDEIGCALLETVWSELSEGRAPVEPAPVRRERDRAMAAAEEIGTRLEEPLSLDELAQRAQLSPFHFLRVFRRQLGVTPHQYLIRVRLRRAVELLLETDRPVTEVAYEAGFEDLSNFVRTFHRHVGQSPGQLRKRPDRKILQVAKTPAG